MTWGVIIWAIGVPLFALAASLIALKNSDRDAAKIRALEAAAKQNSTRP